MRGSDQVLDAEVKKPPRYLDSAAAGRRSCLTMPKPGLCECCGRRLAPIPVAKRVSDETIAEIRRQYFRECRTQMQLAADHNLSQSTISRLVTSPGGVLFRKNLRKNLR